MLDAALMVVAVIMPPQLLEVKQLHQLDWDLLLFLQELTVDVKICLINMDPAVDLSRNLVEMLSEQVGRESAAVPECVSLAIIDGRWQEAIDLRMVDAQSIADVDGGLDLGTAVLQPSDNEGAARANQAKIINHRVGLLVSRSILPWHRCKVVQLQRLRWILVEEGLELHLCMPVHKPVVTVGHSAKWVDVVDALHPAVVKEDWKLRLLNE